MYIDFKKILSVLVILIIGATIGIIGVKLVDRYQAPKQTVSVIGTGEIDAETDQATVSIQVKTTSTTYEKAQEENKKDVDKLKSDLVKLGIPESRITINSYSTSVIRNLQSETDFKMMVRPPTNTTPTVTTNLTLVLDPIKNIEKIFDVVSKNPSAQIENTYYSLKNRKTWESKAKDEALKDIRSQIESIAKINHLKIGKLLTLEDANNPRPYPIPMKALNGGTTDIDYAQSDSSVQETTAQEKNENIYYSEQTVKITSSYTATYELY